MLSKWYIEFLPKSSDMLVHWVKTTWVKGGGVSTSWGPTIIFSEKKSCFLNSLSLDLKPFQSRYSLANPGLIKSPIMEYLCIYLEYPTARFSTELHDLMHRHTYLIWYLVEQIVAPYQSGQFCIVWFQNSKMGCFCLSYTMFQ